MDEKKMNILQIQNATAALMNQCKEMTSQGLQNLPVDSRAMYAISLYSKISNITWDYSDDKILSGCKFTNLP